MISPIVLQRRLTEVGRIRLGEVVPTANGKTRPAKLGTFRFTSADKTLIEQISSLYGGECRAWTPQGGGVSQWETVTTSSSIPVIVPPQSISQWMERWAGGGVERRCTGERLVNQQDTPCLCLTEDQMSCKPTTRLSVLLREVQSIGVFRLESHGWAAASELPGMADLLSRAAAGYVEARLYLKPVRSVSAGKTRDFYVPALAVDGITPAQLLAGAHVIADVNGELPADAPKAIEPAPSNDCDVFVLRTLEARDAETVRAIWSEAVEAGCIDTPVTIEGVTKSLREVLTIVGRGFAEATGNPPVGPTPPAPTHPLDNEESMAERVAAWTAVLASAAPMTTDDVLAALYATYDGREPADCTVAELVAFGEKIPGIKAGMAGPVADEKPALAEPEF